MGRMNTNKLNTNEKKNTNKQTKTKTGTRQSICKFQSTGSVT